MSLKLLRWLGVGIVSACCACVPVADGPRPGVSATSGYDAVQSDDNRERGPAPSLELSPIDDSAGRRLSSAAAELPDERAEETVGDTVSRQDSDDFAALMRALKESTAKAAEEGEEPTESEVDRPVRWAILGSPALRDAGLTDLLTARLSSLGGVELVEREELQSITAEYMLAQLGSAQAAGRRLRLGKILRADRLLLLSRLPGADGTEDAVRLVIADCLSGARIWHECWAADSGFEELVAAVVAAVGQMQRRFPEGVARIVGVSHFVSRNLVHDYDHRQAGYAYLLQHALALHTGTAVLEIEEARAVAQELSLGTPDEADALRHRLVPALVDGEFKVSVDPVNGEQTVDLLVSVHRGKHGDEIRESARSPSDVVALLIGELPRKILELDPEETRFSVEEQRDWLVTRAQQFGLVGAWHHSLGLREAALLIDPGNVGLRLDIITEYSLLMCRPLPVPVRPEQVPTEDNLRAEYRARVDAYIARMAHVEFLIRNRLVGADGLLAGPSSRGPRFPPLNESGWFNWLSSSWLPKYVSTGKVEFEVYAPDEARQAQSFYRRIASEEYAALEQIEATFMDNVYTLIPSLKRDGSGDTSITQWVAYFLTYHKPKLSIHVHSAEELDRIYRTIITALDAHEGLSRSVQTQWATYLLEMHEYRLKADPSSAEDLDQLFHLITEVFPVNADPHRGLMEHLTDIGERDVRQQVEQAGPEEIDWRRASQETPFVEFLNRLAEHDQPIVQVYGRLGLLNRRWCVWDECWRRRTVEESERSKLLAELTSLKEEVDQLCADSETVSSDHRGNGARPIGVLASSIRNVLRSASPPKPNAARVTDWKHYTPGEEDGLPRFEFAGQISMVVRALNGQSWQVDDPRWKGLRNRWGSAYRLSQNTDWYPIVGWRQCTDNLDVLWNEWAVLVMREPGIAEEILSNTEPRYLDVRWDGRHLWIVTKHSGLFVILPTGEIVRRIGANHGLPPYDRGVVLHPIRTGAAFITGSFGDQRRGWCGVVDLQSDSPVRVIHEAKTVPSHVTRLGGSDIANWVYTPSYTVEVAGDSPDQRLLLVAREQQKPPLAIDLKTLKIGRVYVQLYNSGSPAWEKDFLCYSGKGRLLLPIPGVHGETIVELSGGSILVRNSMSRRELCERSGRHLLPLGQWVYVPEGRGHWYRIHRETFKVQPVLKKPSATEFEIRPHTVFRISAHYGIVATSCSDGLHYRPYHQVRIHEGR